MSLRDRVARVLLPDRVDHEQAQIVDEVANLRGELELLRNDAAIQNARTGLGTLLDKGSSFDVGFSETLSNTKLDQLYEHDGLVRRIVDIVPTDAIRPGVHLQGEEKQSDVFDGWLDDWDIAAKLQRALKQARLHGGALLWPVVAGVDDDMLRQPRNAEAEQGRVVAIHVIDGDDATPASWSEDLGSKHFREPDQWHVYAGGRSYTVHASRLVWVRGLALSCRRMRERPRWPDASLVQACWDAVGRLTTTSQAGSVLAHNMQTSTLRVGNLRQLNPMAQGAALRARLKEMVMSRSLLGAVLLGEHDEFQSVAHPPTGFKELSSEARTMVSCVTSIPESRLFGTTPAGLSNADDSGRDNFDRVLTDEQVAGSRYLLELLGFFPEVLPDDGWSLGWGPLSVPSFQQLVAAYKDAAVGDAAYVDRSILTAEEIRSARFGEGGWQLDVEVGEEEDLAEKARKLIEEADPDAPEPDLGQPEAEKKPLNGAQIESVLSVLERAATGGLSVAQVRAILGRMLLIDQDAVDAVIADLDKVKPAPEPGA